MFAKACELALPFGLKESAEQLARSLWRALEGSAACSAASGSTMKPRRPPAGMARGSARRDRLVSDNLGFISLGAASSLSVRVPRTPDKRVQRIAVMGRGLPNNVLEIGNAPRLIRLPDTIHLGVEGADLIPEPFDHFRILTISGVAGINPPFSHFVLHHTRGVDERTMLPNFLVHLQVIEQTDGIVGLGSERTWQASAAYRRQEPEECRIAVAAEAGWI